MNRKHLQLQMDSAMLSDLLFDWLTDARDQVGQFLNTFERFSVTAPEIDTDKSSSGLPAKNDSRCFAYYGNEGKRGAIHAFIAHLASIPANGTIYFLSDENLDWLFENSAFLVRFHESITLLLKRGFRICRITGPLSTADQAFDSMSRWLPHYMTGQVESYYYPRLRDELYRRTLVVLPDVAAVLSTSTAGQPDSRATLFTLDQRLTNAYAGDFLDILKKCRPMMTTYSTESGAEELLRCISQFESDRGDRIQQSTSLSSITSPPALIRLAAEGASGNEKNAIIAAMAKAQEMFRQSLFHYTAIDIHSVATPEAVRAGTVPMSVSYLRRTEMLYYTPETYALHLESIIDHIEQFENYHAVLLPHDEETHALMVKEGRHAILLRADTPLVAFEVSQPNIAEACREYLLRRAEPTLSRTAQRQETVAKLRRLIQLL